MLTNEGRAKLRHLGRGVRVVADLGRPYRCIYHRRGYYTCEDWLAFTETYSLLLLRHNDILEPQVALPPRCACQGLPRRTWHRAPVVHMQA